MSDPGTGLLIWTFSDGRVGIENQVLGLAESIAEMIPTKVRRFMVPRPNLFNVLGATKPLPGMEEPWPDIVIGCGQASLRFTIAMRKWTNAKTLCIQLQAPRKPLHLFDLVIAPAHDRLEGDNVLSITGATNRISDQKLQAAKDTFGEKIQNLPTPRLAVMLGGNSKRHKWTKPLFKGLCDDLRRLADSKVSLMISTSRRTPGFVKRILRRKFTKFDNVWLWTGARKDGENPYHAFLAAADAIVVTSDSTNMLTDAASAGKPVLMFHLDGQDGKFSDLYDDLEKRNHIHPFTGSLSTWEMEPLVETRRAAEEVLRRFHNHLKKQQKKDQPA